MMKKTSPTMNTNNTNFGLNLALMFGANRELIPNAAYKENNDITPKLS